MKQPKTCPENLQPCGIAKTTFGFFIDALLTIGLMVGIYWALSRPVILPADGYYGNLTHQEQLYDKSGLLRKAGEKNYGFFNFYEFYGIDAYSHYADCIWNYFTVSLPSEPTFTANQEVTSTFSNRLIPGYAGAVTPLSQEYGKWIYHNYFGYDEEAGENNPFVPSTSGDFLSSPKGNLSFQKSELNAWMFSMGASTSSGRYVDAVNHFLRQKILSELTDKVDQGLYLGFLPCFTVAPLLFFFILPLCLRNGETIGKLIFGIKIGKMDGTKAKRKDVAIRQIMPTLAWLFLCLPNTTIGGILLGTFFFFDYAFRSFGKSGQAIHDLPSHTVAVSGKHSEFLIEVSRESSKKEEPMEILDEKTLLQNQQDKE